MIATIVIVAALSTNGLACVESAPVTNAAKVVRMSKWRRKRREDMNDAESWHSFARGGKVVFQKDLRKKPYDKVERKEGKERRK